MEILERTSTKILSSEMKDVLRNWVVGLWKYSCLPIFSGILLAQICVFLACIIIEHCPTVFLVIALGLLFTKLVVNPAS